MCKNAFSQEPTTVIKRNNTMIIQLPPGMSRATSNKTGYDKKAGSFIWTVEWVVIDDAGNEKDRFISYRLKEHLLLRDAVPMNILSNAVSVNEGEILQEILTKSSCIFIWQMLSATIKRKTRSFT